MNLQTRVVNILTKPADEWSVVAAEPADVASLFKEYIAILAAIPPVCLFLGLTVVGVPILGRLGFGTALTGAILGYVGALAGVYIAAIVVEKLAPTFGSSGDTTQALKLVAYAYTPAWLAGVLYLLVVLAPLAIIAGLYAIYIFYLGLTPMMKTPKDKVIPYMIVSALVIIVVSVVLQAILGAIGGTSAYGRMF